MTLTLLATSETTEEISVDVTDSRSGTAIPGEDYVEFSPLTISFPPGSSTGSSKSFNIDIIDDVDSENDEILNIHLSNIQGPAVFGQIASHEVIIGDNDDVLTLLGHLAFEDGDGTTALDRSVYGNNGTLIGNVSWNNSGKVDSSSLTFMWRLC